MILLGSPRGAALVAALVAIVVYANTLGNGFAYDDVPVIVENEEIHDLRELPGALSAPYWGDDRGRELGLWRPVTTVASAVQWALWGENAGPYHAVNTLMHAAATGTATLVMAKLVPVGAALVGGLVFAVHPVHVEAVANVAGLAELLAALFLLLACLMYLQGREREKASGYVRTTAISGLFALAFLSKESAVVLPALLILLDAWLDRLTLRDLPRYLKERAGLFGTMAVVGCGGLLLRLQVLGSVAGVDPPLGAALLEQIPRIWTLPVVWMHYVRLLFFPVDLIPDYSPGVIDIHIGWNFANVTGVMLALAFLLLAWVGWRGSGEEADRTRVPLHPGNSGRVRADAQGLALRALPLGILWFVLAILPVSNIFFLSGVLLAERTLYLPSLGLAVAAGAVAWHLRRRMPGAVTVGAAAILLSMAARTWSANPVWTSTTSVFDHLLESHPESGRVQWALADHLYQGDEDPSRALELYRRAIGTNGMSYPLMMEITRRLQELGRYEQAEVLARRTWSEFPSRAGGPTLVAISVSSQQRPSEVLEAGRDAVELDPGNGLVHHLLATAYTLREAWPKAYRHRIAAIENGEGDAWQQWRWLAETQVAMGDTIQAMASLDSARVRTDVAENLQGLDSLHRWWSGRLPENIRSLSGPR